MQGIFLFKNGVITEANITRMFETHGPYLLEDQRLDYLYKVNLVLDSSTKSIKQTGSEISKANTDSLLGRAIVGGVLTGGAGAIIGGLSGQRESIINTSSSETLNTELTAELFFKDGNSMYVLLKNKEAFYWLLSFTNQNPQSDVEIESERVNAILSIEEEPKRFISNLKKAREKALLETTKPLSGYVIVFLSILLDCYAFWLSSISFSWYHILTFPIALVPTFLIIWLFLSLIGVNLTKEQYDSKVLEMTYSNLINISDKSKKIDYKRFVSDYNEQFSKKS